MAALARRQKAAFGRTVTYTRGGNEYTFTAWPASQTLSRQPTPTDGATVVRVEAVYLFEIADATAAGLSMPPQRGDRLTDGTIGASGKTYELQTPTGERAWRFQDHDDTIARVYCQRAGTV
jgi:hypothetical protein